MPRTQLPATRLALLAIAVLATAGVAVAASWTPDDAPQRPGVDVAARPQGGEPLLVERGSGTTAALAAAHADSPALTSLLVGHVRWEDRPPPNAMQPNPLQQMPITLTLTGPTEVNISQQATDASGFFTVDVTSLVPGTYTWRVKGPHGSVGTNTYAAYLANSGSVNLTGAASTSVEMGLMHSGDANNDNRTSALDFSILNNAFGCVPGSCDLRANFSQDNGPEVVDVSDFSTLKHFFGQAGAPPNPPPPAPSGNAWLELVDPSGGTYCNGCTVNASVHPNTFVLELWVRGGPTDLTAQDAYLTFTHSIINNVRLNNLSSCQLSTSVELDPIAFNTHLRNDVCNYGPECATWHGTPLPGSIAYASNAFASPPQAAPFRVARIGLCAIANGMATLNWQFYPSAPANRYTEIASAGSGPVHNPALFANYAITFTNVPPGQPPGTFTGTPTRTPSRTRTRTVTPTVTSTYTPTPTLTPSNLVGHVTWHGRPSQPDPLQQLPITLTLSSGSTLVTSLHTTDASGFFTVPVGALPAGTYEWWVKNSQFLANGGLVDLSGAPTTSVEMGTMRGGDANGDNVVDVVDFNILKGTFGKTPADPGYDPRADFSGDNVVDISDFNVLNSSFGQSGAPAPSDAGP